MKFLNLLLTPILCANVDTISDVSDSSDAVSTISQAISEYGLPIVIMAVFFVIFLIAIFGILRNNSKMMEDLMNRQKNSDNFEQDVITKLVNSALDARLKNEIADTLKDSITPLQKTVDELNKKKESEEASEGYHKDLIGAYIDVNMAFKDASRSAQTELNCDRIAIYVFHNGNKSMHGLPFFKMSCIHEWTSRGNTLRGKYHTDMPLHLFNDFIEDLWKQGVYKIEDVSKVLDTNDSVEEFVNYSNTKSMYMVAIKDDNKAITGFVVAEFDSIDTFEHDDIRSEAVKSILNNMIVKISPIISNKYIYRGSSK